MLNYIVVPTKVGTIDSFSFNKTNSNSLFHLQATSSTLANFNMKTMLAVFSYCFLYSSNENDVYSIDLDKFKLYTGFSYGVKGIDIEKELCEMSEIYGVISTGDAVNLVSDILKCKKIISFKSEYFKRLIEYMRLGVVGERHSYFSSVLLTSAFLERDKGAFEVACVLCSMAERRGTVYGGKSDISVKTLIQRCPYFEYRFNKAVNDKKNAVLKSVLQRAVRIIDEDSVLDKKYKGVMIDLPEHINRFALDEKITVVLKHRNEV